MYGKLKPDGVKTLLSDVSEKIPDLKEWCYKQLDGLDKAGELHEDEQQSIADAIIAELSSLRKGNDYGKTITEHFGLI